MERLLSALNMSCIFYITHSPVSENDISHTFHILTRPKWEADLSWVTSAVGCDPVTSASSWPPTSVTIRDSNCPRLRWAQRAVGFENVQETLMDLSPPFCPVRTCPWVRSRQVLWIKGWGNIPVNRPLQSDLAVATFVVSQAPPVHVYDECRPLEMNTF